MSAYAAVVSLLNTLKLIQADARLCTCLDANHVQSLSQTLGVLQDFLETHPHGGSDEAQDLEKQIAHVADAAEDLIESRVANQLLGESSPGYSDTFLLDLQKAVQDLGSVKERVVKIRDTKTVKDEVLPRYSEKAASSSSSSTRAPPIGNTSTVGLEDEVIQIMDKLISRQSSSRQVIPIVGMGGIGKTTLAKSVIDQPLTVQHFDDRIWVTVSQECTVRNFLLQIPICSQMGSKDSMTDDELGLVLYKSLFGKRYLVIVDDIWSTSAWDSIQRFFPDVDNDSKIVVTTRLSDVATHIASWSFEMNFLDEDKSWKLFCEAFKEASFLGLQHIGKRIVRNCKGLPLAIVVISALLAKNSGKQEFWTSVAEETSSLLINSGDEEHCLSVLSLSYTHLPVALKPCFLYMGLFPEDREILVSQLVRLWIAEGFLKANTEKSLEEVAEDCLKDLADRNIILVRKLGLNGKIKTCYMHDLLRELCLKFSQKEEFFCKVKKFDESQIIGGVRRIVSHDISHCPSSPSSRSQVHFGTKLPVLRKTRPQLRVLHNVRVKSPKDIVQQVNLRFICYQPHFSQHSRFSSSVSLLWNLQTLIIHPNEWLMFGINAPREIWEMQNLRHVDVRNITLPHPPISCIDNERDNIVLKNLHTLMKVENLSWSQDIHQRIPCIKKIKVRYDRKFEMATNDESALCFHDLFAKAADIESPLCLHNISQFDMLETLHIEFPFHVGRRTGMLEDIKFPCRLKKLTLKGCVFLWNNMSIFGCLPNLEVLKIKGVRDSGAIGDTWNPVEGEFCSLKSLKLYNCQDLTIWNAENSHFPVLQKFHFGYVPNLIEIPLSVGDICTLKTIRLDECKASTAISVFKILGEQESQGNDHLKVQVGFVNTQEEWQFKFGKWRKDESFVDNNGRFMIRGDAAPAPHPPKDQLHVSDWITISPPWPEAILPGFQHYLVMLGTTVIIPSALVPLMGGNQEEKAKVIQTLLFVAGLNTLLQTFFGTTLPAVIGGSYTFVAPTISIINSGRWSDLDPASRFTKVMRATQGAYIVASAIQIFLGFSGLWRHVTRFISPLSAVPLVALSGFGLYQLGFLMLANCVEIGLPMLVILVLFSQYLVHVIEKGKNIFGRFAVISSLVIVWIYALLLTVGGAYNRHSKSQSCRTDSSGLIAAAPWIRVPYPFQWGVPSFHPGEAFAMMMAAFVALVESTGGFIAVSRYAGATPLPPSVLSRGVGWQGVATLLSGLLGTANGSSVSIENAGLLALTHVSNRRAVQISAGFMLFFSIFGKFGAIFASIPPPIVGALYCLFFAYVGSVGLGFLQFCNLNSFRNKFILGFSIYLGLSIPQYFDKSTAIKGYGAIPTSRRRFNDFINIPFSSRAFVAGVVAYFLDNTMYKRDPRIRKDCGDVWWDKFRSFKTDSRSDDFYSLPFNPNVISHLHNLASRSDNERTGAAAGTE